MMVGVVTLLNASEKNDTVINSPWTHCTKHLPDQMAAPMTVDAMNLVEARL
jgi:hypothetical protein